MEIIGLLIIAFIVIQFTKSKKKSNQTQNKEEYDFQNETKIIEKAEIQKAYQRKWLLTYNEKDAYKKLKTSAEKYGYTVFTKVRLFDLVEPIKQNPKYKTYLYKIQAKHVDFVLCDKKLVARYIIELDDNSHTTKERKERDEFVDTVLTSTGYKILHVNSINTEEIEKLIKEENQEPQT